MNIVNISRVPHFDGGVVSSFSVVSLRTRTRTESYLFTNMITNILCAGCLLKRFMPAKMHLPLGQEQPAIFLNTESLPT